MQPKKNGRKFYSSDWEKKKKNQARASIKTFLGLQENSTLQVINGTISVSMELSLQRT